MAKARNRSLAVMDQRVGAKDSLDHCPALPWATGALIAHVIKRQAGVKDLTALQPVRGSGYVTAIPKNATEDQMNETLEIIR